MNLREILLLAEKRTGAIINIDAMHPAFYASVHLMLNPEQRVHRGEFCAFAKRMGGKTCFEAKARGQLVSGQGKPLIRECPFGIKELLWPVIYDGEHAATIYLGYFRGKSWRPKAGYSAYTGADVAQAKPSTWKNLRRQAAFICEFALAALEIWDKEGHGQGKHKPSEFYRDFAVNYIEGNYQEDIKLPDLAKVLRVTPNFLSHRLRLACGKKFTELLREKRLQSAAMLLEARAPRSMTEIAFMCGFTDSNHFSTAFSNRYGCPPREYRELAKKRRRL